MKRTTPNSEYDRIIKIRKHLTGDMSDHLVDDYKAVAIHSSSTIVDANQHCIEMFGYAEEDIVGLNAWILFPPSSAETLMKHLMEKSEEPYQVIAKRKDGSLFKVELKAINSELAGEPIRTVLVKEIN